MRKASHLILDPPFFCDAQFALQPFLCFSNFHPKSHKEEKLPQLIWICWSRISSAFSSRLSAIYTRIIIPKGESYKMEVFINFGPRDIFKIKFSIFECIIIIHNIGFSLHICTFSWTSILITDSRTQVEYSFSKWEGPEEFQISVFFWFWKLCIDFPREHSSENPKFPQIYLKFLRFLTFGC